MVTSTNINSMLGQLRTNAMNMAQRNSNASTKSWGLGLMLLLCGTFVLKTSIPSHRNTSLLDPMAAELQALATADAAQSRSKQDQPAKKQYKLPPPISYFKHGDHGLRDDEYCIQNATRDDCCSEVINNNLKQQQRQPQQ